MKNKVKFSSLILLFLLLLTSCASDYLDNRPTSSISPGDLFMDADKAKMAINGMARLMVNQYSSGSGYGQEFCGEGTIKFYYGEYIGENFSRAALATGNTALRMNWDFFDRNQNTYQTYPWYYYYTVIGNANEFLANVDNIKGTTSQINYLKAQALVFRAYSYSQLINFYCSRWVDSENGTKVEKLNEGLVLRLEHNKNEKNLPLVSSGEIYTQVYKDLDEAIELFTNSEETRSNVWEPNINVAYATYARTALRKQDYAKVADMAAKARVGHPLMTNSEYTAGFSSDNGEWIWGSFGGDIQTLHYFGFHSYMAFDAGTSMMRSYPVSISKTLYEKIPESDIRKQMFLNPENDSYNKNDGRYSSSSAYAKEVRAAHPTMSDDHRVAAYMAFKYSIDGARGVGYINHFRSAEMYLIEAEAKYYIGGNESNIRNLMNELIKDSGRDPNYDCTATGEALLNEIKTYRAIELWGEGFDWPDKKRYNEPIVRLSFSDGGNFNPTVAGTFPVDRKNNWVFVTPLYESENNEEM